MKELQLPRKARRAVQRLAARWPLGALHRCCLCGHRVRRFLPYRDGLAGLPEVATDADIIGSDVENFECPACAGHDRERHLLLYLRATGLLASMRASRILHFAPEARLQRLIEAIEPAEYVLGDLHPVRPQVQRLNLTDIGFPDDWFHFVIANHVLEHVDDDAKALREIRRVLAPGGHAILQTPFSGCRETIFEDHSITTEVGRLQAFGQEDHVRLYGRDFAERVASFGFVSKVGTHTQLLPQVDSRCAGVNPREPFLLFSKPGCS